MDPLAEMYASSTPYAYVTNDPVNHIDPNGMYKAKAPSSIWHGSSEILGTQGEGGGGESRDRG